MKAFKLVFEHGITARQLTRSFDGTDSEAYAYARGWTEGRNSSASKPPHGTWRLVSISERTVPAGSDGTPKD